MIPPPYPLCLASWSRSSYSRSHTRYLESPSNLQPVILDWYWSIRRNLPEEKIVSQRRRSRREGDAFTAVPPLHIGPSHCERFQLIIDGLAWINVQTFIKPYGVSAGILFVVLGGDVCTVCRNIWIRERRAQCGDWETSEFTCVWV